MLRFPILMIAVVTMVACMGGCQSQPDDPPPVAATNSLLECAVKDLLGESTSVLRLAEPGMCPGHFDIRPSQVQQLRRCRVLLRLDFQKSLDTKLAGAKDDGLRIAEIRISGGLCEPESYLAACRQTADALVAVNLLERTTADQRLAAMDGAGSWAADTPAKNFVTRFAICLFIFGIFQRTPTDANGREPRNPHMHETRMNTGRNRCSCGHSLHGGWAP